MIQNEFIADENEPSFQIYFENRELLNQLKVIPEDLKTEKYFGNTGGVWNQEELKRRTQFFKILHFSEEFFGFKFPDLFEDVLFIGRHERIEDYQRFQILEVGYFNVDSHFHEEKFYVQVGATDLPNFEGNTIYFYNRVFDKWEKQTAFKLGSRKVFEQNYVENLQKTIYDQNSLSSEIEILKTQIQNISESKNLEDLEKTKTQIQKLQKEQESISNKKQLLFDFANSRKNRNNAKQQLNLFHYTWNGRNLKDFGIDLNSVFSFEEAKNLVLKNREDKRNLEIQKILNRENLTSEKADFTKKLEPKDEFETDSEFENRKNKFEIEKEIFEVNYQNRRKQRIRELESQILVEEIDEKELFNSFLGSQKIEMKYDANSEVFDIRTTIFILDFNFQIEIPRKIAREFKQQVTNFDFIFTQDLVLDFISVNFQNQLFYAKHFKKISLIDVEQEQKKQLLQKKEIASKTVTAGKLMFQDFDLPNPMNWKDACDYCEKLKLLGFTDWRLPKLEELKISYQNKSKFKNIKNSVYWSNTTFKIYNFKSWIVDFYDGFDSSLNHNHNYFVVCVRDME